MYHPVFQKGKQWRNPQVEALFRPLTCSGGNFNWSQIVRMALLMPPASACVKLQIALLTCDWRALSVNSCTVYVPETDALVVQATVQDLKDCGFDCWETSIGGPGVQQHSPLSVKDDILEILGQY